ncbi:PREDICTED: cytosolic sulfotransferase 15-like isoform X3 [Fragaria vesca subsp. vesca]|uniref:cytosolic sulfotransferase 15-like isoform X3 n=1 Tax=Fragaria vesca subsp. vesca TaxID=101020 RepID=UPI0002C2E237|nr:PREDICTED: cytosolic sulfotransferase 15-like isoform X3 [Fragaria vesca subsp. vesca]
MADHEEKNLSDECKELLLSLPKERGGWLGPPQYQYQGFWCVTADIVQATIAFQRQFQARDSDIVVASVPKCGTTWLKALTFAVVNRHRFEIEAHPLLTSNSHNLVQHFEVDLYINNRVPDFSSKFPGPLSLDETFDKYCQGMDGFGPFWDHILRYWKESLKRPNNVLFFKYEDMKKDVVLHLKALAKFIDCPFTEEEERNGVIEDMAKLCSFDTMKKLEVNKTGTFVMNLESKHLFRKAEVGDWVNYLTPMMKERMSRLIEEKFSGSGLTFEVTPELADS